MEKVNLSPRSLPKSIVKVTDQGSVECSIPQWKYTLDQFLVLVSAPLWGAVYLLCAIWIKLLSPGPVFFRQERVGYRQECFLIYKFRTMHEGTDTVVHEHYVQQLIQQGGAMQKLDHHDTRIIRGGTFLRASGLDELPQLLNVIRGEMSLVGPRPCTPKELQDYPENYKKRFTGLPGMTGNWQVNGKNETSFARMIALDILYFRKASIWLDLRIIMRTVPTIVKQIGHLRLNSQRPINEK